MDHTPTHSQLTRVIEEIPVSQLNDIMVPTLPDFRMLKSDGTITEPFGVMAKVLKSDIRQGIQMRTPKKGGSPLKCFAVNLKLPRLEHATSKHIALTLWEENAVDFHQHMMNDVRDSGEEKDYIIYQWCIRSPWKLYKPNAEFLSWHSGAVANLTYTKGLCIFLDIAIPSIYEFDENTTRFVFEESPDLRVVHPDRWDLDILDEGSIVRDFKHQSSPKKECIFKIRTSAEKRSRADDEPKGMQLDGPTPPPRSTAGMGTREKAATKKG
jgi:hypothetical protein